MVEELNSMVPRAPFAGDLLRQHYEDMLARDGVSRTLADAKDRYRLMVLGDVPPLRGLDANEGGCHDEA